MRTAQRLGERAEQREEGKGGVCSDERGRERKGKRRRVNYRQDERRGRKRDGMGRGIGRGWRETGDVSEVNQDGRKRQRGYGSEAGLTNERLS